MSIIWPQTVAQMLESSTRCTVKTDGVYTEYKWSLYLHLHNRICILAVYVDDILLAGKSQQKIAQVKANLRKDMGELHYFLGVSVQQYPE